MKISIEFAISIILILLFAAMPFIYSMYLLAERYLKRSIRYRKAIKWRKRHKQLIGDKNYIYSPNKIKSIYPESRIDFNTYQKYLKTTNNEHSKSISFGK